MIQEPRWDPEGSADESNANEPFDRYPWSGTERAHPDLFIAGLRLYIWLFLVLIAAVVAVRSAPGGGFFSPEPIGTNDATSDREWLLGLVPGFVAALIASLPVVAFGAGKVQRVFGQLYVAGVVWLFAWLAANG